MDERPQIKTLTSDLLDLFYQILIFCESDAINTKKLEIKDSRLTPFINKETRYCKGKIILTYNIKSKKKKKEINFEEPLIQNEIRFINTKENVIKSILWHFRHSFAHNRIRFKDNAHTILCMENRCRGAVKMKAQIRVADLKKFVNTILSI